MQEQHTASFKKRLNEQMQVAAIGVRGGPRPCVRTIILLSHECGLFMTLESDSGWSAVLREPLVGSTFYAMLGESKTVQLDCCSVRLRDIHDIMCETISFGSEGGVTGAL